MPFLLLLVLLLHYGEGKCCKNFRFFAVGTDVYAVARRGFFIVLGNDYINTSRGNTAALFCLPRSLTQHAPCFPFPFLAFVAGSQVVSSGEEAPSSRAVRPSTRSRRGRRRSDHSPSSSSPDRTPGADEGQESGDSGSQGNEGSDGSSVSRQSALPADPQQRAPHVEEAPSDSGARRQRRSATSPTSHHHEQPRLEDSPGTGTPPLLSSASRSMDARLEQARRRKSAARAAISPASPPPPISPTQRGRRGDRRKGGVRRIETRRVGRRTAGSDGRLRGCGVFHRSGSRTGCPLTFGPHGG